MKTKILVQVSIVLMLSIGLYAQEFKEVGKIVDKNIAINANLGSSLCLYKDLAIIGASHEHFDANGEDSVYRAGAVYVFSHEQNGNWNRMQKIVAPDRKEFDQFGSSLSFSDNYLIIGANINNYSSEFKDSLKNSGSVYIYKNNNGFWQFMQSLPLLFKSPRLIMAVQLIYRMIMQLLAHFMKTILPGKQFPMPEQYIYINALKIINGILSKS